MLEYTDYLKFLSSFIIIVFFLYAIYYFVNQYGKGILPGQKGLIKILDLKYLSKGKGFAIIKANREYFLVSFDEKEIKVIKEWNSLQEDKETRKENDKNNP
ncbi:hypothetical protein [Persephonella sp.]